MRSTSGIAAKPRKAKKMTPNGAKMCERSIVVRFSVFIFVLFVSVSMRTTARIRRTFIFSTFSKAFLPLCVSMKRSDQNAIAA